MCLYVCVHLGRASARQRNGILMQLHTCVAQLCVCACRCNVMSRCAGQTRHARAAFERMRECVCVCVCAACLHVILSRRWQVRESNVMRLSPLWFKHEHGNEGETERGSQFSSSKRRLSLQLCNSLPHFYCKEDPSDKKKKRRCIFCIFCMDPFYRLLYGLCWSA